MRRADRRPDRPRLFCIGLNKTATSSFHEAVQVLGYRSLHHGGEEVERNVSAAIEAKAPLLSNLDQRYDAFSDIGQLSRRFVMLSQQYPGSRFVLTVRPLDEWLDSRRRHAERNVQAQEAGRRHGRLLVVDEEKWRAEWSDHLEKVHRFFRNRDDLLEIDLTDDPTWSPLCAFLGRPEPSEPFPWANRDRNIASEGDG